MLLSSYTILIENFSFSDTFAGRSNPTTKYSKDANNAETNRRSLDRSYETEFSEEENEFSERNDAAFESESYEV